MQVLQILRISFNLTLFETTDDVKLFTQKASSFTVLKLISKLNHFSVSVDIEILLYTKKSLE